MRLVNVHVPEFRALKNIDITFEPDFYPQVFPLGSLNGGGKSTLLQLIFVLLNIKPTFGNAYLENSYFKDFLLDLINTSTLRKELSLLASITLQNNKKEKIILNYFYGDTLDMKDLIKDYSIYFAFVNGSSNSGFIAAADIEDKNSLSDPIKSASILTEIIDNIRKHIFLISPSNQSYLFSTQEERRLPYMSDGEKNHNQTLKRLKDSFPNFFTYDFIDVLTEIFRLARDKDYNERLKTGVYGTHSEQLEKSINNLFIDGKKITPLTIDQKRHTKDSIQSMGFKLPSGEEIYPEDLSHGELKRLTIFILFQYYEIQDAIILMDEIENGFHPDWQRHIVDDLLAWGPSNQYILATHSYELCRGVTPAHVKEIYPKLPFEPEQQL